MRQILGNGIISIYFTVYIKGVVYECAIEILHYLNFYRGGKKWEQAKK